MMLHVLRVFRLLKFQVIDSDLFLEALSGVVLLLAEPAPRVHPESEGSYTCGRTAGRRGEPLGPGLQLLLELPLPGRHVEARDPAANIPAEDGAMLNTARTRSRSS